MDEFAHEIYLDLRENGFDLVAWLGGREYGTVKLVLEHIRELPEGTRYTAIMSAPERREGLPEPESDPVAEAIHDRRFWTPERRFEAQKINALHQLVVLSGQWKKGKEPEFPVVGPMEWQPESQRKKKKPSGPVSVADAMKAFGWTGQIQQ